MNVRNALKNFLTQKLTRVKLNSFLQDYRSDGYTLDIGCGGRPYKDLFPNSVCVDIDEKRNPDIVADIHHMSQFADDTFDCILCTEVLEHCYDPYKAADELFRVLKRGGVLLLTTRFLFPIHDAPGDYFRFTKYGLQLIFRNFLLLELREEAAPIETMGILYQRLAFQTKTKTRFQWLVWLCKAKLYGRNRKNLIQYGNMGRTGEPVNAFTSGYYLALRKPE